jgi:hypothetical protein
VRRWHNIRIRTLIHTNHRYRTAGVVRINLASPRAQNRFSAAC